MQTIEKIKIFRLETRIVCRQQTRGKYSDNTKQEVRELQEGIRRQGRMGRYRDNRAEEDNQITYNRKMNVYITNLRTVETEEEQQDRNSSMQELQN